MLSQPLVKTLLFLAAAAALWMAAPASAGSGAYKACTFFNGQVSRCGKPYKGKAVAYHNAAYRECDILNGQIRSCDTWYQGKTVAYHDGAYRECDIANGQILSCSAWYDGKAVIYTKE